MQRPPEIKICGLTRPDEAVAVAQAGADAIGLIFYPPSPRHIDLQTACEIAKAIAPVPAVGVFVDALYDQIMATIDFCGLRAVQLHGNESSEQVAQIRKKSAAVVIKALFEKKAPGFSLAAAFNPDAFLVECGQGTLPGGNAEIWDWASAGALDTNSPIILAGGLTAENVVAAATAAKPAAIDVSSGVEKSPGRKDISRVKQLIATVKKELNYIQSDKPIFTTHPKGPKKC